MAPIKMNPTEPAANTPQGVARHVRPAEFRALAVSHRQMVREDNAHAQLRGLRDVATGELFLIDERVLRTFPQ